MQTLIPTYSQLPKETRLIIKEKVKDFIITKLGSESLLSENIIWARAQGVVFSTFGIPPEWESEFKDWSLTLFSNLLLESFVESIKI
jgi:hypothetical protein